MAYASGNDREYESRDYTHEHPSEEKALKPKDIRSPDFLQEITIGGSVISYPIVHKGVCYVGANDKYFYALSAEDGSELWRFLTGGIILSGACIYDDILYFGSADNYVYALSAKDGKLLWKFKTGNGIVSTPMMHKGVVYCGSSDGHLYALNKDGGLLWKFRTGGALALCASISGDRIYFGSFDSHLYSITTQGDFLWRFRTGNGIFSSPSITDKEGNLLWDMFAASPSERIGEASKIFFSSFDGYVYSLSANGDFLWRHRSNTMEGTCVVSDKKLYFGGNDGYMRCLSLRGEEHWKKKAGEIAFGPNVVNGVVYFGSADHNLRALSASSGDLMWMYRANDMITTAPFVENDTVYFGSWDGYFSAVKNGELLWKFRTSLNFSSKIRGMEMAPKLKHVVVKKYQEKEKSYATTLSDGSIRIVAYSPATPYKIGTEYAKDIRDRKKEPYR